MSKSRDANSASSEAQRAVSPESDDWPNELALWRSTPAEEFDDELQARVSKTVNRITSTDEQWRAAIRGDAAAAVKLALQIKPNSPMTVKLDLAMTVLLRAALNDAAAALVLAHCLNRMPLDQMERARLATSWLVHNVWIESRRRN